MARRNVRKGRIGILEDSEKSPGRLNQCPSLLMHQELLRLQKALSTGFTGSLLFRRFSRLAVMQLYGLEDILEGLERSTQEKYGDEKEAI